MVLWMLSPPFLLWLHQQRLKGIFPLAISEKAASPAVSGFLVPQGHILCVRTKPLGALVPRQEEAGGAVGVGLGAKRHLELGRGLMAEGGWVSCVKVL